MRINKKHIVFDWNGTLVNDAWIFVDILNVLLLSRGLKIINSNDYRQLFSMPIKSFYKKLGFDVSKKSFKDLEKDFIKEYKKRMFSPQLFDCTIPVLKELLASEKILSILSASNQIILNQLLKYYKINHYFQYVVGVDNYTANGKLASGLKLLNKLGCQENDVMLIGDTDSDYRIAKKINIDSILIANGHQSRERLNKISKNVVESIGQIIT